jgi:hypothetical protein
MRDYSSWRFTGSASLLTAAVLLWIGVFLLSWPASGAEVSSAFTMVDTPHAEQLAGGYERPIGGNYPAVFAEEDEAGQMLPKNATLLRALSFVLFFGLAFVRVGASGWKHRGPEVGSPIGCRFHSVVHLHQRRAVATLLGVFRL